MADLSDLTNPFNLRRLRWWDDLDRIHSNVTGVLEVDRAVTALRAAGVKRIQVDRLSWTKVYEVGAI